MNWISVKERLPDEGVEVLVYCCYFKDNCSQEIASLDSYGGIQYWDLEGRQYLEMEDVTHWMPLPEPPEAK